VALVTITAVVCDVVGAEASYEVILAKLAGVHNPGNEVAALVGVSNGLLEITATAQVR
jgi:hypothetical protein